MSRVYDNWERLVGAVLKREDLRRLALCESLSSSISADFSLDSFHEDVSACRISTDTVSPGARSTRSSISYHEVQCIGLGEIRKATKYFQRNLIIGEGGFGTIYKGWIDERTLTASKPGSGTIVAVKKLKQNNSPFMEWNQRYLQGREEWMKEIHLSQLHHPNLVRLIGYCCMEENMILVYEFMPKGSLDNHLFRSGYQSFSWETRIKVAIGAARALSFLHDKEIQATHFNSKDILLDADYNAKLSGFGLARDGPTGNMTHVSIQIIGRAGYAAPEYIATGHLTAKCDVYSFGVVLLELLCGLRAFDRNRVRWQHDLVEWAKPFLGNKRKLLQIMDARLEGQYPRKAAYSTATLALQCLSFEPKQRPRMSEVLVALEQL